MLPEEAPQSAQTSATASLSALESAPYPAGLTAREVDVLRLLAQGLTNKQIAEQLVLSPKTVNSHLASIFRKTDVSTRAAATRFAFEQNLL